MKLDIKDHTLNYIIMILAIIADIALIINIVHHW